jgi:hypothetical protein
MIIFSLYKEGFRKSLRTTVPVLMLWVVTIVGTLILVRPVISVFDQIFSSTIITDLLYGEYGVELFYELIDSIAPLLFSLSSGLLIAAFLISVASVFIMAGLFRTLYSVRKPFRRGLFFKGADRGFPGYLLISVIFITAEVLLFVIIVGLPFFALLNAEAATSVLNLTVVISFSLYLLILPLLMFIADYARVNLVADKWEVPVQAIRNGIGYTFRNISMTWSLTAPLMIVSMATVVVAFFLMIAAGGATGLSAIFMLIVTQATLLVSTWMRVVRYAAVSALYES